MKKFFGYKNGVNLGGWISQCSYEKDHIANFITQADIDKIASWGCDHVRLPFDYNIILDENGAVLDSGLDILEKATNWCESRGLNIILDLHKTMGFSFDKGEQESGFFESANYQDIFVDLWVGIAKRFGDRKNVAFELLNEITEHRFAEIWNRIAARTIAEIRKYAPDTPVLIGGIYQNSIFGLTLLDKPCYDNIVFNFHYYEPLIFTHQKAYWIDLMKPDCTLSYPGRTEEYYSKTLENIGADNAQVFKDYPLDIIDKRFIEKAFEIAADVSEKMNVPVYCGEYGVIENVCNEDMMRWLGDMQELFNRFGFGRAIWNYKGKDFGVIDKAREQVVDEITAFLKA